MPDFEVLEAAQKSGSKTARKLFFWGPKRQNPEVANYFRVLRHAQGFAVIRDEGELRPYRMEAMIAP